jgi:Leucine-rich repeat (LRR) protein
MVKKLRITDRGAVMNPSSYDENDDITNLGIYRQTVHYVPKFTVKFATRIKYLTILRCGLKEIRKEDLKQFPQLEKLWLGNNDLEWLEGDLFAFNPELVGLSFDDNEKLKYIGENLVDLLPRFREAVFRSAGCIEFIYTKTYGSLEELKTKLNTECKDEATRLKMLAERTTTTTTESATSTTLATS